ncbi:MAG: hypothetical protein GY868_07730 [Deltaproteobacteria bacterium]|nr:hypothetical protein [Deltaproteobacteria bacterium]
MGIKLLEKRYQDYIKRYPENVKELKKLALQAKQIQLRMRELLDVITAEVCPECNSSCCMCMPVEGWFTDGDYYLYRMLFDAPFELRVNHAWERGCAFLSERGCVLDPQLRPFPCVKVNCKAVTSALEKSNALDAFNRFYEEISALQEEIWPYLKNLDVTFE